MAVGLRDPRKGEGLGSILYYHSKDEGIKELILGSVTSWHREGESGPIHVNVISQYSLYGQVTEEDAHLPSSLIEAIKEAGFQVQHTGYPKYFSMGSTRTYEDKDESDQAVIALGDTLLKHSIGYAQICAQREAQEHKS